MPETTDPIQIRPADNTLSSENERGRLVGELMPEESDLHRQAREAVENAKECWIHSLDRLIRLFNHLDLR